MKISLFLPTVTVVAISANVCAISENNAALSIYTDSKVEFTLPENTVPLEKQKCGKESVAKVPMSYTNFQCSKVLHNGKEYLILENTAPKNKRTWQYKIMALGDRINEAGDLNAEYTIVPVLVGNKSLEFLAVNIDKWSLSSKKDHIVSYERYQIDESGALSISPVGSKATIAKSAMPGSGGSTGKLAVANAQGSIESTNSNDSGLTPILRSSVTPPPGSPPNDVIEQAVREELQGNIPERWVEYGTPGLEAKFGHIEIVKWGAYNENFGYFPVKIRVAGDAVVYDLMFKSVPKHFDDVAEFRFAKDDYGDWKALFFRPGVFGGGSWVD